MELDNLLTEILEHSVLQELKDRASKALYDNFVHLHLHTTYSFFDGFNKPEDSARRAKELGMTAQAITDHNHLAGVLAFQKACVAEGIKPLLGYEGYHTWDSDTISLPIEARTALAVEEAKKQGIAITNEKKPTKDDKEILKPFMYDTTSYHILFLAKNQKGWSNIVKMQSESSRRATFNGRYHCDTEMMRQYSEGVIMTTACIQNTINELFITERYQEAYAILNEWHSIYGDDFYVELQPLSIRKQWLCNIRLIDWANENNVKIIVTTDVHYTLKEDHEDHDTLFAISLGKLKNDHARMHYSNDYWIKSYDEMLESFANQIDDIESHEFKGKELYDRNTYMEAIIRGLDETNRVAEKCEEIQIGSKTPIYPEFDAPLGMSSESYLTHKCYKALYAYKKSSPEIDIKIYERRLQEELEIINPKGFAPYMLIVDDYIDWANKNDVETGPGRGSAAGSLVLFLLGVTKIIDPIKYSLLFFRFLTADRTAAPDIDTDFNYETRYKVIEYLENKYGKTNVCRIGTFTALKVKSGLKEVGRTLEYDFPTMNGITKQIDEFSDNPDLQFKHLDKLKDGDAKDRAIWAKFNALEEQYPELFRLARRFEGVPKNAGIHASGTLITPMPISDILPTRTTKEGLTVTLNTGVQLEDIGFIKFDILGLKTISVIKNTLKTINEQLSFDDLYAEVKFDDAEVYGLVREKKTEGLFQIESNLFKGMIEEIKPTNFNDIVVMNALGRPGPLSAGMPAAYARRKNGEEQPRPALPRTDDLTENTLGTIAYQEQLMLIAQRVAGFNGNQADSYLRKATAKKDRKKMDLCKQWFIYGKLNCAPPTEHDDENKKQPFYDEAGRHGDPILGGINNGYEAEMLEKFWSDIEGYCTYLFNLSHSACYSYITLLTSYLKKYYPSEFMAATLSMEANEEKVANYIDATEAMGIRVMPPDVNVSGKQFTPKKRTILFGLGSIKGIGNSVDVLLLNRPYASPEDLMERVPKKQANKTVLTALAKSGAFDQFSPNRFELLNRIYDMRKDKDDRFDPMEYSDSHCMDFEKKLLGAPISIKPYWDNIKANKKVKDRFQLVKVSEKVDKSNRMMGFVQVYKEGSDIKGLIFASNYGRMQGVLNNPDTLYIEASGKKDDRGTFIIDAVKAVDSLETPQESKEEYRIFM